MPSFIIVGYVWQILGRGDLFTPTICEQPRQKSILNRVKGQAKNFNKLLYVFNWNLYDKQEKKPKFVNQMQIIKRILF